jgi:hypothetical protein
MPELLKACAGCGRAMAPNAVLYDAEARPVCDACFAKADLLATDHRAADNIRKAGYACLAGGVGTLFAPLLNFAFLVACIAVTVTSAAYAMSSLSRGNERFSQYLTPMQKRIVWGCSILGLNLMALALLGANFGRLLY